MSRWLLPLCLLVVAAVFAPSLRNGFVNWDDDLHVYADPLVVGHAPLRDHLLTPELGYPTPVTVLTYRAEHALFGLDPRPYHATNLLLHLIACALVFLIGRRLGLGELGAAAATLLFGLHPVVTEPVAWVSGRKDLLAAVFTVAATLGFLRKPGSLWSVAFFALAALSKPAALFLPIVLVAWRGREALRAAIPMAIVAIPVAVLSFLGERHVGALAGGPTPRAIAYALGWQIGTLFGLHAPSPKYVFGALDQWTVLLLPLAFAALVLLWTHVEKARPGLIFAGLAYLPASNLVPLVRFVADVYVYLPLAGLAWAAGAVVDELPVRPLVVAAIAIFCAPFTLRAEAAYRDSIALWTRLAERYPASPQVCRDEGNAYLLANRLDEAIVVYRGCEARFGDRWVGKNLAIALALDGQTEEARARFEHMDPRDPIVQKYLRLLSDRNGMSPPPPPPPGEGSH